MPAQSQRSAAHAPAEAGARPARPRQGIVALVVDDDPDALTILQTALEHVGVKVVTANSAEAAMTIGSTLIPDVVISDLSMPGEDGYWLIKQLRKVWWEHPRLVPAIAITAYRETHNPEKAVRAGFNEFVEKPLDPFALLRVITRVLAE